MKLPFVQSGRWSSVMRNSSTIIFGGRAVSQAGFFVFIVSPVLVLPDVDYNDLVVAVTVALLAIVAPVGALQLHLIRSPIVASAHRDALAKSMALAAACSLAAGGILFLLLGFSAWMLLILAGGVLNVIPTLGSSLHAIGGRFGRSAALDAVAGLLFAAVAVPLVMTSAALQWWAVAYASVWLCAAVLTAKGPLAFRHTGTERSFGTFTNVVRAASAMIAIGVVAMAFNRSDYLALTVVGTDSEAARYALAGRFVGPIMIALGSLNNSLYVRQIELNDDPAAVRSLTIRASRTVGILAAVLVPLVVAAVAVISNISDSFGGKSLIVPTALLGLATVAYAFAVPFGFGLVARGQERLWLLLLVAATAADLVAVLLLGQRGATTVAGLWVLTQVVVLVTVIALWSRPMPHGTIDREAISSSNQ